MRKSVFSHSCLNRTTRLLFAACIFVCVSTASRADDLTIRAAFDSKAPVLPNEKIDLFLSRSLQPADGSLAVLIGDTDVTAMLMMEAANVSYTPRLPLPAGESDVTVRLVLTGTQWKEIARETFSDLAGQTALGVAFTRGAMVWSTRFEIAGSSFQAAPRQ
jgi:hypothetical protein